MTHSLNEVMTLASKAARGAGVPPAQAMQFGQAVVCHLNADRDPQTLIRALQDGVAGPCLNLPFLIRDVMAQATTKGPLIAVDCPDLAHSYADALPFVTTLDDALMLEIDLTQRKPRSPMKRCEMPTQLAAVFKELAAKTFVPETESSRLSGAGAGLTDND